MKLMSIFSMILFSTSIYAVVIDPIHTTCNELQNYIEKEGHVYVRFPGAGPIKVVTKKVKESRDPKELDCDVFKSMLLLRCKTSSYFTKDQYVVQTRDTLDCNVGYLCRYKVDWCDRGSAPY